MKVILLQDVENLGELGDQVVVKDGYARNYLMPREIAAVATEGVLRSIEKKRRGKQRREEELIDQCREDAEKIKELSLTIPVETGEDEKLFGSVTTSSIAEVLKEEGFDIDKRKIELDDPIKELGVYSVDIKLHPEVTAQARIWVVKK